MTAKKNASAEAEAKRNPFEDAFEGTKNTRNEEPKAVDADKKETNDVIVPAPENAGTEDAKLDIEPLSAAQVDADKADEANKQSEAAAAKEKAASKTSSRRTKEEKLADDIEAARALLGENGFNVQEHVEENEQADFVEKESPVDFDAVDFEKYPLSAVSGQIVGSISLNQGAVPTLQIALQNWIGQPPVAVAASQIGDVEEVLKELKKLAKANQA